MGYAIGGTPGSQVTVSTGDIQLGAVEIKDATTDNRCIVTAGGALTVTTSGAGGASTTGTVTSVSGSASSVTLLAANSNRLGATIFNDSSADLYVKLAATASTTSFTAYLRQNDYYEVPANYTGIIDGIWASATGDARITELT